MAHRFFLWEPSAFERTVEGFNRIGGALAGACAVLALTMGLLALRNRDLVATLFGLTILLMLRVAAFNSGWDIQWLGFELPPNTMMPLLRATLALAAISQTALFLQLFRTELLGCRIYWPTLAYCSTFGILLAWSPFADNATYLKTYWSMTAVGALWLIFALTRVVTKTRDRAARLYVLALAVTMAGVIAEIAYYWGWWDARVSASLLGVLFGAAINAAAVAERLYTERARAMEAQRRELLALRAKEDIFQQSPVPLFDFDVSGRLRHANSAFRDILASRLFYMGREETWDLIFGSIKKQCDLESEGFLESQPIRLTRPPRTGLDPGKYQSTVEEKGETFYFDLRWSQDSDGIHGSVQDVTDRELARQAMQRLIRHDQLTDVLNVHGLLQELSETTDRGALEQYSLALVDIARFESINELFGHEAGDVVLKTFAKRLESHCNSTEKVARVGADTFAVVFSNASLERAADRISEIAHAVTRDPVAVGGKAIVLAVCVGVVSPGDGVGIEQAIGASLRAAQRAKRKRSGSVSIALETNESLGNYLNEKRILGRIADRLPTENFFQLLQPIINLRCPRGPFAAEALIRMRAENGDVIPPAQFIAAAERNGMMQEIDCWTLRTACEWLNSNQGRLYGLDYLTINVSGVSLNDVQFHSNVRATLSDFPTEASKLCFEITESIAVTDIDVTNRFTDQLRAMGARVALDDFGAGYTSFGYLRTIPAEILKIDGEIVRSVATDPSSAAILRAIRDIAGDLGMRCVAEYVSNFDTLRALRELDIDYGQGFVLSRPVEPARLIAADSGIQLVSDAEVIRYLDSQADRSFTTQRLPLAS